jgi:hypothetical protein
MLNLTNDLGKIREREKWAAWVADADIKAGRKQRMIAGHWTYGICNGAACYQRGGHPF